MPALSAQAIVHVWEVALHQHPVDRALTLLTLAFPEMTMDELLALSVGQRDANLLDLRQAIFGSQLAGFAKCPACEQPLEFNLSVTDIRVESPISSQTQEVDIEGYQVQFRLPNSTDLRQVARCREVLRARQLLVERCVLRTSQDGADVGMADLPDGVIVGLIKHMAKCDPQAEIQLDLHCPVCQENWSVLFDIVSFLWSEICVQAKRLLREVHTLARAYGWHEADILSMSAVRRQFYLEMVT
jgi:hypothetical protein